MSRDWDTHRCEQGCRKYGNSMQEHSMRRARIPQINAATCCAENRQPCQAASWHKHASEMYQVLPAS